jgi:ribosomal protein L11 methyltransferase
MGTAGMQSLPAEGARAVVLAYFDDRPGLAEALAAAVRGLEAEVVPAEIPEVDWVARVREGFRPFDVGSFRIAPAWDAPPGPAAGLRGRVLLVEPGLAFGTGSHESTRLCLGLLERLAGDGALGDVLDVGTGSGVLSVAAARLGARRAAAVEIDPEALPVARRHAELNHAPVRIVRGDGARPFRPAAFDVVVANLSAPLLAERARELVDAARPDGHLILSGLLTEDVYAVRGAFRGVSPVETRAEGAWSALLLRRDGGAA